MDELQRSQLKAQLQQQIDEEFAKRTKEHLVKVHAVNARRRYRESRKLKV
jgi:hypothetical protein